MGWEELNKRKLELTFIMGTFDAKGRDFLGLLEEALRGGVTCFQLREQGADTLEEEQLLDLAYKCKALCKRYKAPFIVNENIDLALEVEADGVHIEHVNRLFDVQRRLAPSMLVGVTATTRAEAIAACEGGADYIGIGPLFGMKTVSSSGLSLLKEVTSLLPGIPIIGIGGISERKVASVIRAGASGIAVISAIAEDANPESAARRLRGEVLVSMSGVEV